MARTDTTRAARQARYRNRQRDRVKQLETQIAQLETLVSISRAALIIVRGARTVSDVIQIASRALDDIYQHERTRPCDTLP